MVDALAIVGGLVVLAAGADRLVHGAARLALHYRWSPVVVGAVVVGCGTSAPEFVVSGLAAGRDATALAAGNIVGSNLANVSLVLGAAGLMAAPRVVPSILRREAPLSMAAVAGFALALQNGLSRLEGVLLLVGMGLALAFLLRTARHEIEGGELVVELEEFVEKPGELDLEALTARPIRRDILRTVLGLLGTVLGAQLLVSGAQGVADNLDISEGFVGITLVAAGTSLPELVTAIASARRGETALLIGNVLGSNLFNSLAVGGLVGVIGPQAITDSGLTVVAVAAMVFVCTLAWAFLALGQAVSRWESAALLAVYVGALPFMAG